MSTTLSGGLVARAITAMISVGHMARSAVPTGGSSPRDPSASAVPLPPPATTGSASLEGLLAARRSVRSFAPTALTDAQVGQLLWAAQGVTDEAGHRTAPSAGARHPLELHAATPAGVWRYLPREHALAPVLARDVRPELRVAALDQETVGAAPLVVVVTGVAARTSARYGPRAERYVSLEAGHATQNLLLQAVALGLGAVPIGAFGDPEVARVLRLPAGKSPLYPGAVHAGTRCDLPPRCRDHHGRSARSRAHHDRILRPHVLEEACRRRRSGRGRSETLAQVAAEAERMLQDLHVTLRQGRYDPERVRRRGAPGSASRRDRSP
jgi:SagB-type dehydrogenase family enzyme